MSLLRTRLTSSIHNPIDLDQAPFVDALRLLPLKEQVNLYNQHCLEKLSPQQQYTSLVLTTRIVETGSWCSVT